MPRNELLSVLATFLVSCTVIWISFFVVGRTVLVVINERQRADSVTAALGMAVVCATGWLSSMMGLPGYVWAIGLLAISVFITLKNTRDVRELLPDKTTTIGFLMSAIAVTLFYAPGLNRFGINLFSLGNQDIMGYSLDVKHLVQNSFRDFGSIENYDAGWRSQADWSGTKLIATFGSVVAGGSVVNTMIPVMGTVLIQSTLGASNVVFGSVQSFAAKAFGPVTVLLAVFSPLGGHVYGNYLLGNAVAMCLAISTVSIVVNRQIPNSPLLVLLLFTAMSVSWSVAAFLLLGVSVLTWLTYLTLQYAKGWRRTSTQLRTAGSSLPLLWIPAILGLGGIVWAARMGFIYASSTAGWKLPTNSFFDLLGFTSDVFQASSKAEHLSGGLIALTLFCLVITVRARRRNGAEQTTLLLLLSLSLVTAVGWIYYESTSYSFWKLESLTWPLILLLAVRLLLTSGLRRSIVVAVAIALALLSVNGLWSASKLWSSSDYTLGIDVAITKLKGDPILRAADGIQVDLGGGWREMSAMVVIEGSNVRSLNDTFFPKMPPTNSPRLVSSEYIPNESERVTPLANGFFLVTPAG
jgi:hypothetical protein